MATEEARIRRRIDDLVEAVRAGDLEAVQAVYAPDIVSFDVQPPLQHVGAGAKRQNWVGFFSVFRRPVGYESHDLTVVSDGDVAFAHSLNRISGTLPNGSRSDGWVRWTACFRKVDGDWLITHDHVSVPVDPETGSAAQHLEP